MEARLHHYSGARLQVQVPAARPAPAVAVPDARPVVEDGERAFPLVLNANAVAILALLICALVAALTLHVALQCALRVTRRACYGAGDDAQDPEHAGGDQAARRGSKKQRLQALPCLAYSAGLELAGSSRSECAICLAEFARGDRVRVLPRCNHGFHARCIDRWFAARPTCPTCRQAPFAERPAILQPGTGRAGHPAAVQLVRVVIVDDGVTRRVEP